MGLTEDAKKKEEQWFKERDRAALERLRQMREERLNAEKDKEEAARLEALKAAHFMCCPKCGHPMKEESLSGIMIDRCTRCEGIFFDHGELGALVMKQAAAGSIFRKLLGLK